MADFYISGVELSGCRNLIIHNITLHLIYDIFRIQNIYGIGYTPIL